MLDINIRVSMLSKVPSYLLNNQTPVLPPCTCTAPYLVPICPQKNALAAVLNRAAESDSKQPEKNDYAIKLLLFSIQLLNMNHLCLKLFFFNPALSYVFDSGVSIIYHDSKSIFLGLSITLVQDYTISPCLYDD